MQGSFVQKQMYCEVLVKDISCFVSELEVLILLWFRNLIIPELVRNQL